MNTKITYTVEGIVFNKWPLLFEKQRKPGFLWPPQESTTGAVWYWLNTWSNEWRHFYVVRGIWGQTQEYCYSRAAQTTLAGTSPTDPMIYWACQLTGADEGCLVASQLTWRGSHRDKSQFTQGAVTLNDIFTGWLYSSFDNALATSFISLKDERTTEKKSSAHWGRNTSDLE